MKKLGLIILSIAAILVGAVILLKDKIFGETKATSDANANASKTASTANVAYVTPPVSGTAVLSRSVSTTIGSISSGKIYIQIENTGSTDGTINVGNGNSVLRAGETWFYNEFKTSGVKQAGEILFNATGTSYLINTEQA